MHNLAKTVEGCLLPSSSAEVKWCLGIVVRQFKHCRAAIQRFGRVAINGAVETKGGKRRRRGLDREATQIILGLAFHFQICVCLFSCLPALVLLVAIGRDSPYPT